MAKRPSYIHDVISNEDHTGKRVGNGGGDTYDPDMEARVAVLEEIATTVKATLVRLEAGQDTARDRHDRDFRITFGAIITVALGLAALMAKGFKWF